jgi:hypothetical protein
LAASRVPSGSTQALADDIRTEMTWKIKKKVKVHKLERIYARTHLTEPQLPTQRREKVQRYRPEKAIHNGDTDETKARKESSMFAPVSIAF